MAAAAARLRAAGVPDPARDARVLLAHAASVDASRVTLIAPEEIAPEIAERFENLIALRAVRVPVSHLVGQRAFYGRDFRISRDVLDPRPETETLIELALSEVDRRYGLRIDPEPRATIELPLPMPIAGDRSITDRTVSALSSMVIVLASSSKLT